ncbi:MAG: hypothetical protein KY455_09505 [Euryarchaeota archaeon]|nr:hypothetical protein [Euryarchaeota archaeon]
MTFLVLGLLLGGAPVGQSDPQNDALAAIEDAIEASSEAVAEEVQLLIDTYTAGGQTSERLQKGGVSYTRIIVDSDGDGVNDTILDRDGDGRADAWLLEYTVRENCRSEAPPLFKIPSIFVHQWLPPYLLDELVPWVSGEKPANDCYDEAAETDQTHPSRMTTLVAMNAQFDQSRRSFITSDYVYTPQNGSPPAAMFVDRADGTAYFAQATLATQGSQVGLTLWTNADDAIRPASERSGAEGPVPFATFTLDHADTSRLLVLQVHDEDLQTHDGDVEGLGPFVAPFLLDEVVLLPAHDPDQDGHWTQYELATLPMANPYNRYSVPFDADGDGCRTDDGGETRDQDRSADVNPCASA